MNPEQIKQFIEKSRQQNVPDSETMAYLKQKGVNLEPKKQSAVGGFLKSIVSAPATMIARPIQAVAELGAKVIGGNDALAKTDTALNNFSKNQLGGIVAPTPNSMAEVKKDAGRAVQTAALGAGGPVAGGAAFGLGTSLENGNDLFSVKTALDTALGAAGGKVLGLVGKPIFNVAGKVVGEVTPQFLKDLTAKGTDAITKFAAEHEILPQFAKNAEKVVSDKLSSVGTVAKDAIKQEVAPITSKFTKSPADRSSKILDSITPDVSKDTMSAYPIINKDGSITPSVSEYKGLGSQKTNTRPEIVSQQKAIETIPNYPESGTPLEQYNSVVAHNINLSKEYRASLAKELVVVTKKETYNTVKKAVDSVSQNSLILQKTDPIVKNYMRVVKTATDKMDGNLGGVDELRLALDKAYKDAGGKYANNKGLDQIHDASREALNGMLKKKATNTKVEDYLTTSSNLYDASETLLEKAAKAGGTAWKQFTKKNPVIKGVVNKVSNMAGVGEAVNILGR